MKEKGLWLKRALGLMMLSCLVLTLPSLTRAGGQGGSGRPHPSRHYDYTDQLIVKLRKPSPDWAKDSGSERVKALSASAGLALTHFRAMSGNAHVFKLPHRMTIGEARAVARKLGSDPGVEYAEPDRRMIPLLIPDDPEYAYQWHYKSPNAPDFEKGGANLPGAWDVTTGSSSVVVAVIDTGLVRHADIDDNILDGAGRVVPGYDFVSDPVIANDSDGRDGDPSDPGDWITAAEGSSGKFAGCYVSDSSWHGTHVAGTIGALSNNGAGVAGINWASKILPVRVLGKCGGYESDIIDGMRWAAGLPVTGVPANANPARVLNLSLGGYGACGAAEQSAINEIMSAGAVVVAAAGNAGADASNFSPASCSGVISVAAVNRSGGLSFYSNFGQAVKIAAPGGELSFASDPNGVLSTLNTGTTSPIASPGGDTYRYYQGTSMAAPHVTGIVSLMLSIKPALTPAQVLQTLQATARVFPTATGSDCTTSLCGAGIVNAHAAVQVADSTGPYIGVSPAGLAFTAQPGGVNPAAKSLSISNIGEGTLNWSVSGNAPWLGLSPANGTGNGTVTVSADITGLAEGTYTCSITLSDPGAANSPVNIPVTLEVAEWTMTGLWHPVADAAAPAGRIVSSPTPTTWWYGQDATGNYDTGTPNSGSLITPAFAVSAGQSLSFWSWEQTENSPSWDTRKVYISTDNKATWTEIYSAYGTENQWYNIVIPLSAYSGAAANFKFTFDTIDSVTNNFAGWYIDDVSVVTTSGAPPVVSNPDPADGAAVVQGTTGQLLRVYAPEATNGTIHYDADPAVDYSVAATLNDGYLEATIPYTTGQMNDNGTNYWYVQATNSAGTTRYPASGSLSFTVTPNGTSQYLTLHAPMPTPVYGAAAAAVNGKIYAIGGITGSTETGIVQVYDTSSDTWTAGASKPTPAAYAKAAVINGKIYVPGGFQPTTYTFLNVLEIYDPVSNTWSVGTSLPVGLAGLGVEALAGKLYVMGGYNGGHDTTATYVYDPATEAWNSLAPINIGRDLFGIGIANGQIYIFGGQSDSSGSWSLLASTEVYDPAANTWTTRGSLKTARVACGGASLGDKLYAFGGRNSSGYFLQDIEVYDPATNTWNADPARLNAGRDGLTTTTVGDGIYVVGGFGNAGASNLNESYDTGPCSGTYSLSPTSSSFAAEGGTGNISVTAGESCPWTAVSTAGWITITSGTSGAGNGTVSYSVSANADTAPRTGTIIAAGRSFTVTQAASTVCANSLYPTNNFFTPDGGPGIISVTSGPGCPWTAASNDAWITVTGGWSGTGSGTVSYLVSANTGSPRTGTMTVAGLTFTVNQSGVSEVDGWTMTGLWHPVADAAAPAGRIVSSPTPTTWWYGQDATGNYDTGTPNSGSLITPAFAVSAGQSLSFWSWEQTENSPSWDMRKVYISTDNRATWTQLYQATGTENQWYNIVIPLSAYSGATANFKFTFDTIDSANNSFAGWYIDDVSVVTASGAPPVVSNPDPADGAAVVQGTTGQLLRVYAPEATNGTIHYDADPAVDYSVAATLNDGYLEATIPYTAGQMNDNGTNYWYVQATNSAGTTRYPASGSLSFTVTPNDISQYLTLHAPMPTPVFFAAQAAVGEKTYTIGGYDNFNASLTAVQIYDTSTNTWTTGAPKPTPAGNANAAMINGKIYIPGGIIFPTGTVLDVLEVYEPSTNQWSSGTKLPVAVRGAGTVTLNGKLYVMGGVQPGEVYSAATYVYDPDNGVWSTLASMQAARGYFGTGVMNGKIYVFGGTGGGLSLNAAEVYDPATNAWTTVASMNTARMAPGGASLGGKLYAFGGLPSSSYVQDIEVYDPITNIWSIDPLTMNMARYGVGATAVGNSIYVMGGYNGSPSAINESYDTTPGNCTYSLSPTSNSLTSAGGAGSINVTAGESCPWTAAGNDSWIAVTGGWSGTGSGTVNYLVSANTGSARTGTITVAGLTFAVYQANPVILTWPNPAAITYGTPLSATQLNATANVPGSFVYNPPAGTILNAGAGQTISVTFTPTDMNSYVTATASIQIDVLKAVGGIILGGLNQTYDRTSKSATYATTPAGLTVVLGYDPPVHVNAGSYAVTATINDVNYQGSATGTLVVAPRPLTVTAAGVNKEYDGKTAASVVYADNRVAGDIFTVSGAAAFTDKNVGKGKTVTVSGISISGPDAGNYTPVSGTVITTADIIPPDGDIDGGGVSVTDALRALRITAGLISPTSNDLLCADVAPLVSGVPSPNGVLDLGDVVVILRRSVGLVSW